MYSIIIYILYIHIIYTILYIHAMSTLDSAEWRNIKDRVPEDSEAKPQGPGLKKHRKTWRFMEDFKKISGNFR
jgi:hypothetical protein